MGGLAPPGLAKQDVRKSTGEGFDPIHSLNNLGPLPILACGYSDLWHLYAHDSNSDVCC